jgi:tRNA(Ile)-lysidine synthase
MRAGDRVAVAVSGGADSVALLRVLLELRAELGIVLAVAHFNHLLREQAAADEAFVVELAQRVGVDFFGHREDVGDYAAAHKLSIEAAGRKLRHEWFAQLAREERLDCIATAHTLDDQAETVLLKLLRGASTRGLAGIHPVLQRSDKLGRLRIVRPMLSVTRAEVEAHLASIGQSWREDESNRDRRFLRNRIRHELLPMLEREYNPNLRTLLRDLGDISRGDEEYWTPLVEQYLATHARDGQLNISGFGELPLALQRRVVRGFGEQHGLTLDFDHVEDLRRCALGEIRRAGMPGSRLAVNERGFMRICPAKEREEATREQGAGHSE